MIETDIFSQPEIDTYVDGIAFFYSNGIEISYGQITRRLKYIPVGATTCIIDFKPIDFDLAEYANKTRELAIVRGLRGLTDFFEYLEKQNPNSQRIPNPDYLYGVANKRMANFARRLGFFEIEELKDDFLRLPEESRPIFILAETKVVREKLDYYKGKYPPGSKLYERAQRQISNLGVEN